MKKIKSIILILSVVIISSAFTIVRHPKENLKSGDGVLLVYVGTITGYLNLQVGVHVEIDPEIGVSYSVVIEQGDHVLSNSVLLWKYKDMSKYISYDRLNHRVTVFAL